VLHLPAKESSLERDLEHPALRGAAAGRAHKRWAAFGSTLAAVVLVVSACGAPASEESSDPRPDTSTSAPVAMPTSTHELAGGTVELFFGAEDVSGRSKAEQNAHAIIASLIAGGNYDRLVGLLEEARIIPRPPSPEDRRLMQRMGEPIPPTPRATGTLSLELSVLPELAAYFADNHLPLDDLNGFAKPRGLEVPAQGMTPAFADRFVVAVSTLEVLNGVEGQLNAEQTRALEVIQKLEPAEVAALRDRLGVQARPGADVWITNELIDRFIQELHARILYLDPMGIDTVRAAAGLGRGTEIDPQVARTFASLPDLSREVTNCALGSTQTFRVHPIGIDVVSGNVEYLRVEAAHAFGRLLHEAPPELGLFPRSGYRSNQEQQDLQSTGLAAPVCGSNHEDGNSVDIGFQIDGVGYGLESRNTPQYQWLAANAPNYGIVNDVSHEPWHHTLVG
jgi:hypothetical protein